MHRKNVVFLPLTMPEKKRTRSNSISAEEILAMYEVILPLIYDNPEGLDIAYQINKQVLSFIQFDSLHYIMEGESLPKRFSTHIETWSGFGHDEQDPNISVVPAKETEADDTFEESINRNYRQVIDRHIAAHPASKEFYYHRIESRVYPRIVIGFFRDKNARPDNGFTPEEIHCFDGLAPHILRLFRVVLTQVQQTEAFKYFDSFAKIGSRISAEHDLSEAETNLIPDILFGYSSEEIAERHFVSLATVKTHVNHILKKTGTKSRLDFIGKFFTSPGHVQL
jgi:DNA-binding CsgD family transcriptional regulator